MVIRENKDRQNNVYSIELVTEFNSNELDFISAYGEPQINVGGTISYGDSQSFSKQSSQVLIRSQFPVSFQLDALSDADAVAKVDGWALTIRTRLQTALTTLLDNSTPNFPSTTVYSIHG